MRAIQIMLWAVLHAVALFTCGCTRGEPSSQQAVTPPVGAEPSRPGVLVASSTTSASGRTVRFDVRGEPLNEDLVVGKAAVFGELTVFPILAKTQLDVGPIISLDAALAKGVAEVREVGAGGPRLPINNQAAAPVQAQNAAPQQAVQLTNGAGGGAEVGTLIIENKGAVPVFVLAGTVVKGGNQDRQIGQDFIISPLAQVPVDAFCVEHGRWSNDRQGAATGGKFTTLKQLANAEVRSAAQYEGDQGKVWSKVSEVNVANKKRSSSDSLLASLDDAAIVRERDALARQIVAHLEAVSPAAAVVGFGYAIGGQVKGVRWFVNNQVFESFQEVMANTSAIDTITARSAGETKPGPKPTATTLVRFVRQVEEAGKREVRATKAANHNEYVEAEEAYGSSVIMSAPSKPKVKMSSDFVAK